MSTNKERLNEIKSRIDWHCENNFNKDYHKVVKRLIKELGKNKNFSMDSGKEGGWVAGLLYVVGEDSDLFNPYNFGFDKEYYSKTDVANGCGVSVGTMKSRAQKIREALPANMVFKADISQFDNNYADDIFDDMIVDNSGELQFELDQLKEVTEILFGNETQAEKYKEYQLKAYGAGNYKESVKYMKKAIEEAKNKISPEDFKDLKGQLWLEHNARPYMRLKKDLADLYYLGKEYDKSIKELWELIELNGNDNQGVRFDLANQLLNRVRFKDFEKLMDLFKDDTSTFMIYSKALYAYKKGDILNAKRYIKMAFEENEYVPQIIMGLAEAIRTDEMSYTVGGQDEASLYVVSSIDTWVKFDDALYWLVDEYYTFTEKKGRPISIDKDYIKDNMENMYEGDFI